MSKNKSVFHIVSASGKPYECGLAHGKALKPIIHDIIGIWAKNIQNLTGLTLEKYAQRMKTETLLFKTVQTLAPELLEEVHGIADGAEMPRLILETWQYIDEHEWFIKDFILGKKNHEENACSTFAFKNPNQVILGQNLDIPSYKNGIQTILKIKDTNDFSTIIFTQAGALASLGINNSPLAICVNSLTQLAYRYDGLPVTYIVRKILQNKTIEEAVASLKNLPHATAQNYVVGNNQNFQNYECSANQTALLEDKTKNHVFHTNHILINSDTRIDNTISEKMKFEKLNKGTSIPRYECLQQNIGNQKTLSLAAAQKALSTPPVSISVSENMNSFTFFSVVFDLSATPKVYATSGAPKDNEYIKIDF
jgi:isopenicillin-N N-acyltransferase-like protein